MPPLPHASYAPVFSMVARRGYLTPPVSYIALEKFQGEIRQRILEMSANDVIAQQKLIVIFNILYGGGISCH